MTSTARPCKATNKSGEPCKGHCMPDSEYCLFHDPARAAERAKARQQGGMARHGRTIGPVSAEPKPAFSVASIEGVQALLGKAVSDCMRCEPSLARARTLAALCGVALKVFEVSELEQRLTAIEGRLEAKGTI